MTVSPLGYTICYEPSLFEYFHAYGGDSFVWRTEDGLPVASISTEHCAGQTLDEAIAEWTKDLSGHTDTEATGGGEATVYYLDQSEEATDERSALAFVPDGADGVFVFSLFWCEDRADDLEGVLLNMLSTVEPGYEQSVEYAQCDLCGRFYPTGNIFRNHICVGQKPALSSEAGTAPTATPKASGQTEPEYVYCEVCGGSYEAGNVFRNHICVPQQAETETETEPEYVYCEICGGWYEAGNVFRNHVCVPME